MSDIINKIVKNDGTVKRNDGTVNKKTYYTPAERREKIMGTVREDIANNIREQRLLHHWTQKQLAEHMGVTIITIMNIEGCRQGMSIERLVKFADVLGCPVDTLVQFNDRRKPYGHTERIMGNKRELQVFKRQWKKYQQQREKEADEET